ncbi:MULTISPECIES: ubiquinone-dependent pyruvate dehydrogenase [unclassified Microbacterium]|uniref:ubiquinone-dependent pyruvate dehydrogenase n=1 Tax=unclassified Microbacterium TaxID=2609290 RepID=UPI00214CCED1|nr:MULTISPECIES: ubiquinone-dependent pyruvate dehydrogenase [unclassified Microbacterium]MCR2800572.1 ubiquinone-dependent pyruvate dehydrogenase [Microbacterium sp. zg.Y818]MCR2824685.1 ubiquinone-dependent pyruvate dehydrogenase [Microbacterium sp. zg.Y909]WIM23301.1 ubiquinone-dependent pyruvate dehydrogenase [Microbacterium sp. zg-Y818]
MATVAGNIVKTLHANGIDRVYGLPGDSLNAFTDALRKDGTIRWLHVRHEESAAFAAAADAALTGQLAVVAASCGPGNLHLINGLFDANRSRVPVLAIAAHIPTAQIGTGYFQETHPQELFRECSVYVEYVADPQQMPRLLEIAMRAAIEQRGVAVLVIPGDVALAEIGDNRAVVIERSHPVILPSAPELDKAAALLDAARKVTILAGAGVEGAHDEVVALADRLAAPIVHSLRGKEFIEHDNPFDVGMTGLLGFASGYRAMEGADALLVLGSDFPYEQFYPERATTIQVDIRGSQLGRRHPLDLGLVGDAGATAAALLPRLAVREDRGHLDDATAHYRKTRAKLDELAVPAKGTRPIHPQYLTRLLNEQAADDAIFTADVGSPTVWAARYLSMTEGRRLIGSFTHGSMANALLHGIGAQVSHPDRQVVALAGDGGLAMMLGELLTLTQNALPVKTIVVNNSSLNFIELEMKAAGFVTYGTGLTNPSFAAIAEAMGIFARRVERSEDLPDALREVLDHDGPALLDVVTERQELSMPPAIEAAQVKGFALYAIRTVMSGRGDELLDLAKANWRQLF